MATLSVTKIFNYEAAHVLNGYDGLCANIHGHSYRLEVSVTRCGTEVETSGPKCGMLMDFSDLKALVNRTVIDNFDHALVLNEQTDAALVALLKKNYQKIITLPFQPTSENMVLYFAQKLQGALPENISLKRLRLYETATSFTDWEV